MLKLPLLGVGANEPLSPIEDRCRIFSDFCAAAELKKRFAILTPIGESLKSSLVSHAHHAIQIGQEPIFQLKNYFKKEPLLGFPRARSIERKGAQVIEKSATELTLRQRKSLELMTAEWMEQKGSLPLGFLNQVQPWQLEEQKKYFLLEFHGRIYAFISAVPVFGRNGFYFNDIIRSPHLKTGMSELLIIQAMRALNNQGFDEVRLGMCPLAGISGKTFWEKFLTRVYRSQQKIYPFHNLARFKSKLKPTYWENRYLVSNQEIKLCTFRSAVNAHFPEGFFATWLETFYQRRIKKLLRPIEILPRPKSALEMIKRTKLTLLLTVLLPALHVARFTNQSVATWYDAVGFLPTQWNPLALLFGPLFHHSHGHLLGDISTLFLLGGMFEFLMGTKRTALVFAAGLWLSNPLTGIVLTPLLKSNPEFYTSYVNFVDYGSSNAVYAAACALAALMRRPLWFVLPFGLNAIVYAFLAGKWLALHHLLAMAMGYGIAKRALRTPHAHKTKNNATPH